MLKKYKFTISFISWMVFITYSSLSSFKDVEPPTLDIPHLDKLVHFTFYFVATVLALFFVRELTKGTIPLRKALLTVVLGAVVYGAVIEGLQFLITVNRSADIFDALANSLGALSGAWSSITLFSEKSRLKWRI